MILRTAGEEHNLRSGSKQYRRRNDEFLWSISVRIGVYHSFKHPRLHLRDLGSKRTYNYARKCLHRRLIENFLALVLLELHHLLLALNQVNPPPYSTSVIANVHHRMVYFRRTNFTDLITL